MSKLYYVGSPYTHDDQEVVKFRMKRFSEIMAYLIKHRIHPVSPLMNHFLGDYTEIEFPLTWDYWEEYSKLLLEKCNGLVVITVDGWEKSTGLACEIKLAKDMGIPVYYVGNINDMDEIINNDKNN